MQKDVVFGLQQGTKVLKQIHAEMGGIEQVEKLIGENDEARAYQREVSEMLAGQMSNQDEDEVEDELEALEIEVCGPVRTEEEVRYPATPEEAPKPKVEEANGISKQQKVRAQERANEAHLAQVAEPILA